MARRGDVIGMKTWSIPLVRAATFVLGSGCAKPDWIQQTLVTVEVTGVWVGSINHPTQTLYVKLELEQNGSKVTGSLRVLSAGTSGATATLGSGPVEGTIGGDVLSVMRTNGTFKAEIYVHGEDVTA